MERYHATSVLSPNHAGLGAGGAHAKALRSARFTSSWSRETMLARAVFSEGDAARPTTASQPPGAHDRLASITGQGWRGRISLERVLVDRDGPAIVDSRKRRMRIAPEAHYYSSGCSSSCFMYSIAPPRPPRKRPNWPSS